MLHMRDVQEKDCSTLFDWANDPSARKNYFSTDLIRFKDHQKWFQDLLNSSTQKCYVFEVENIPIGQVRIDFCKLDDVFISINICQKHRGKGYSSEMLKMATTRFLGDFKKITKLHAYIGKTNLPSQNAFKGAGFSLKNQVRIKGIDSYCFIFSRDPL